MSFIYLTQRIVVSITGLCFFSATGTTLTPGSHVSRSGGGGGGSSSGAQRPVSRSPARPPTVTVSSKGKGENQPAEDMATRSGHYNADFLKSIYSQDNY